MTTNQEIPKSFIQRAREGKLFDPATGHLISEARAAEILQDLHYQLTRTDGKAIREDQVAAYLQDFTELPVTATQRHQAALEGKPLGADNTEKVKELRSVMSQVEIELAAGNLQPTGVEAYIQQQFPDFHYDLKVIQDAFIDRNRKFANYCEHSTSIEQLMLSLENSRARFSPDYTNEQIITVINGLVADARAGKLRNSTVSKSLVLGGFIPNKTDNPIYLALHRLEQSDPQILAQRQQKPDVTVAGAQVEAPVEAANYSLSLSIVGANNVSVETDPRTSAEMVRLIGPDGTTSVRIPLSQLQVAFAVMESITYGTRVGSAHDIDSLMLKHDLNSGKPSHLLVGGKDISQNNAIYGLSISGEALTKLLDIIKPPSETPEGQPTTVVEKMRLRVNKLAQSIKDILTGHDSKDEIIQNETSVEIPKPGISTLKAPEHFNQDRSGSGDVSYEITDDAGNKVLAELIATKLV